MENKSLSIVMPVYNEEGIIEKSIRDYYNDVLSKFSKWQFIVINDCSKDSTLYQLKAIQKEIPITIIDNEKNLGHGPSLIRGYKLASNELIFHTDSDYQFNPKDFWKLYAQIETNDFVLGCRDNRQDPLHRLILSQALKFFLFLSFGVAISDVNSPFRIIKKGLLQKILSIMPDDFPVPSVAMSIYAKKKEYKFKEVTVGHLPRLTGKVSIMRFKLLAFCFKALKDLMGIRRQL